MAKINAEVQLSPTKPKQEPDEDVGEDDEEDNGESSLHLLNAQIRTPKKTQKEFHNGAVGELAVDEELLRVLDEVEPSLPGSPKALPQEPTKASPSKDDRRKSTIGRVLGSFWRFGGSGPPSNSGEQVAPLPSSNGRARSDIPAEGFQTPMSVQEEDDIPLEASESRTPSKQLASGVLSAPEPLNQDTNGQEDNDAEFAATEVLLDVTAPPPASEGKTVQIVIPTSGARKLSPVKVPPTDLSKRKRPTARRDQYSLSPSPPSNNNDLSGEDDPHPRPAKKARLTKKKESKPPIVLPKIYKPLFTQDKHLNGISNLPKPSTEVPNSASASLTPEAMTTDDGTADIGEPIKKRKRGRPRKHALQSDDPRPGVISANEMTINDQPGARPTPGDEGTGNKSPGNEGQVNEGPGDEAPDINAEEGVDAILMDPSPKKPPHLPRQPPVRNVADFDIQANSDQESDLADLPRPKQFSKKKNSRTLSQNRFVIDFTALESVLDVLKQVGCTLPKGEVKWVRKYGQKKVSESDIAGLKLERKLNLLNKAYDNLRTAKEAGNPQNVAQENASVAAKSIAPRCDKIVDNFKRLDADDTKMLLTDLYFVLFRQFAHVIKIGADAHWDRDHDFIESSALQELLDLLGMLYNLITEALKQPKESQPGTPNYQTVMPLRSILPILRTLRTQFRDELKFRERNRESPEPTAEQLEELEAEEQRRRDRELAEQEAAVERLRVREVERQRKEEQEEALKRQRQKAIHKAQKEALARQFTDPYMGHALRAALAKEQAKQAEKQQQYAKKPATQTGRKRYLDVDDDPFADDVFERVSVFGTNNNRQHRNPLSWEERNAFLEIMRTEHGDDRYQKAANNLGRSIEEIFDFAKEFQEAMDSKHENGEMNRPEDEWTYDVWVESH